MTMKKTERRKAQDDQDEANEELDAKFDSIRDLLTMDTDRKEKEKALEAEQKAQGLVDDYDAQIRAMMFDKRAAPTNRVKTEAEIEEEKKAAEAEHHVHPLLFLRLYT